MIKDSIVEAKVTARMVELRSQGKDHATLIGIDEAMYLKVAIINVL
jgi:23S rRNA G2069 N7-methylase RlmK/C1962 C5-methylase RlmI